MSSPPRRGTFPSTQQPGSTRAREVLPRANGQGRVLRGGEVPAKPARPKQTGAKRTPAREIRAEVNSDPGDEYYLATYTQGDWNVLVRVQLVRGRLLVSELRVYPAAGQLMEVTEDG